MAQTIPIRKKDTFDPINDDFCEKTKKDFPELKGMSNEKIKTVVKEFNQFMVDSILKYREGISLPSGLGHFLVGCYPGGKKDLAFKERVRKNHEANGNNDFVYNTEDQDGFIPRMFFITKHSSRRCKELAFYGFTPEDSIKYKIRRAFEKNWKRFIVVMDLRFISNLIKEPKKLLYKLQVEKNEFKFD